MCIPYMWSKDKSAIHIFNVINAFTKDRQDNLLVDLFTWWFAVSEIFIKKWWQTINNDKNKYVMELLKKTLDWLPDEVYNWVSRDKFKDVIDNPDKYDDWYVWYIQCIWSFWNNQKRYLYWKEFEELKKSWDDLIVRWEVSNLIREIIPQKFIDWILKQKSIHTRRIALSKVSKILWNKLQWMQRLQNLERLQRLQRLQNKQNIKQIIKWSYNEVEIPKNAIVYCDPPYKWTATYAEWWFDHTKFWEYIRNLSKTNKVFISEYTAPDDFRKIYEFSQKSCLQWWSQSHNNQPNECLFIYNW